MDQETCHFPHHTNSSCCYHSCWPRVHPRKYDRVASHGTPEKRPLKVPIWTHLWRKWKKDKKSMFQCTPNTVSMRFTYDPHSYSQNFDQDSLFADPDDLRRSFSARFAVPSTVL